MAVLLLALGTVSQAQPQDPNPLEKFNRIGRVQSSIKETSLAQLNAARINIPSANFDNASPAEVLEFLRVKSKEYDPQRRGLNIIVPPKLAAQESPITLGLSNVSMDEALKQIATLTKMRIRYDTHAVIFAEHERPPIVLANPNALCPILRRADAMILPEVAFSGSTLNEVVEFLRFRSQTYEVGGVPMNIVLRVPPNHPTKTVTLALRDIPMSEALRYVAELTGLTLRAEPQTLMLLPRTNDD
jgi:hypothetical protein